MKYKRRGDRTQQHAGPAFFRKPLAEEKCQGQRSEGGEEKRGAVRMTAAERKGQDPNAERQREAAPGGSDQRAAEEQGGEWLEIRQRHWVGGTDHAKRDEQKHGEAQGQVAMHGARRIEDFPARG